jgi:hypothetical protein
MADKPDAKQHVEAPPPGHDGKADKPHPLQAQVQDIHSGGNVKQSDAHVAEARQAASTVYGHLELTDHGAQHKQADGKGEPGKGDAAKPEPAKPEPAKAAEAAKPESGVWGWASNLYSKAEHAGESLVHSAEKQIDKAGTVLHDAKTYAGEKIDQVEHKLVQAEHSVEKTVSAVAHSDTLHNAWDVTKTLASGVGESAMKAVHGVEHGVEAAAKATENGVVKGAEWAYHNPGKAAAIVGVGAAIAVAEVASGGAATAFIAPALATAGSATVGFFGSAAVGTAFEVAGVTAAATATANAGWDVYKNGEIHTIMNQQNEKPADVQHAREQLKKDTGDALLGDLALGGGFAIKAGAKAFSAARGTGEVAAAESTTAGATSTAGAEGAGAHAAADAHAAVAPESAMAHIAEEIADAGSTAASFASLLDKVRSIAIPAYESLSGTNSTVSTFKNAAGMAGRIARGYPVAAPQGRDAKDNHAGGGTAPDEPTKH